MRFFGKSFFSPKIPDAEPTPEVAPVSVAPDPDDKAEKIAGRRRYAKARKAHGRLSTINTADAPLATALG